MLRATVVATLLLFVFWVLVGVVIFTTVAPLTQSVQWWVRGWDFPRVHIAAVSGILAVIALLITAQGSRLAALVMIICMVYQLVRVYPYTSFASTEITLARDVPQNERVSLLSANVLMENDNYAKLRSIIDREDPDVLFLMETDKAWEDALSEQLSRYDAVLRHPADNHYGAIFATKLDAVSAQIIFLTDDETPSILAELDGPTGPFYFVGLHPRPPVPGQNTDERDEQIRRAAMMADRTVKPVVVMGDFNDVAWSRTSEKFKTYGSFLDPRVGRGMLPSFDARSWWMRFPIDQLYVTQGIDLVTFDRLEPFGSDHFPMKAVVRVTPD